MVLKLFKNLPYDDFLCLQIPQNHRSTSCASKEQRRNMLQAGHFTACEGMLLKQYQNKWFILMHTGSLSYNNVTKQLLTSAKFQIAMEWCCILKPPFTQTISVAHDRCVQLLSCFKLYQVSNMFETAVISRRHTRFWSYNLERDKNCIELCG